MRNLSDPTKTQIEQLCAARSEGLSVGESCREIRISTRTYYEWKRKCEKGELPEFERVLAYSKTRKPATHQCEDWQTAEHFIAWAKGETECSKGKPLILDSGEIWEPEQWQVAVVEDLLSGEFKAVLLVVPESNGKTTTVAGITLYLLEHQLTPEIPVGSASVTQAETLFRQIEGFIIRSDKLEDFKLAPGVRRIDSRTTLGHARVYPHNERSGDGVIPSLSVLDEVHLHPDLRLWRVWKGKYRKRRGPIIGISTAGEPGSEFEELRTKILKSGTITKTGGLRGQYVRAIFGDTCLHDYAVRDRTDATNFEIVAEANPLAEIDAKELEEKYNEPEMTPEHWLRRTCNIPTHLEGVGISAEEWDALKEDNLAGHGKAYGWLDLGWKIDTTAIGVYVWESATRRLIFDPIVFVPPVSESEVVEAMVERQKKYEIVGWVFDPNSGGRQMAQQLEAGEHPRQGDAKFTFIEHSQDNTPMSIAAVRLDEAIREKWLHHDGDRTLRNHVLNAVRRSLGSEKYKYDRPNDAKGERRNRYPIDALTGLLMANSIATAENSAKPKEPLFAVVGR